MIHMALQGDCVINQRQFLPVDKNKVKCAFAKLRRYQKNIPDLAQARQE